MRVFLMPLCVSLAACGWLAPLSAQVPGGELDQGYDALGGGGNDGLTLAIIGDLDGDGRDEFALGAEQFEFPGNFLAGRVTIRSGFNGLELHEIVGTADQRLGSALAGPGDLTGDGIPDFLVGASRSSPLAIPNAGRVQLYSGADYSLVWTIEGPGPVALFGSSIAIVGDLDGNGKPEFVVGAPNAENPGGARVGGTFMFRDSGAFMYAIYGQATQDRFGSALAGIGDVDGDALPDFMASSPQADPGGLMSAGRVGVFSGATGSLVISFDGANAGDFLGGALSGTGDLTGNGVNDLVVGAPNASPGGVTTGGSVYLVEGGSFNLESRIDGGMFEGLGAGIDAQHDVDGDGVPDLVIGAPGMNSSDGGMYVYSGANGSQLLRYESTSPGLRFGTTIVAGGDFNRPGDTDWLVGMPGSTSTPATIGRARAFSFLPYLYGDASAVSQSAGGSVQFDLDLPSTAAGFAYRILVSRTGFGPTPLGPLLVPLTPDGLTTRTFNLNYPAFATGFSGTLDAFGDAAAAFAPGPAQFGPVWIGRTLHCAAIVEEPGVGWAFSSIARCIEIVN